MNHTEELIQQALRDPNLAPPGGCLYVDANGCRCIVGTVLHRAGVEDAVLQGRDWIPTEENKYDDPNALSIKWSRTDLKAEAENLGLDVEILSDAQRQWDDRDGGGYQESITDQYHEIHGNA